MEIFASIIRVSADREHRGITYGLGELIFEISVT